MPVDLKMKRVMDFGENEVVLGEKDPPKEISFIIKGGPSVSGISLRDIQLTIRVEEPTAQRLQALIKKKGLSINSVITEWKEELDAKMASLINTLETQRTAKVL